jgi:hypothetical protein
MRNPAHAERKCPGKAAIRTLDHHQIGSGWLNREKHT